MRGGNLSYFKLYDHYIQVNVCVVMMVVFKQYICGENAHFLNKIHVIDIKTLLKGFLRRIQR